MNPPRCKISIWKVMTVTSGRFRGWESQENTSTPFQLNPQWVYLLFNAHRLDHIEGPLKWVDSSIKCPTEDTAGVELPWFTSGPDFFFTSIVGETKRTVSLASCFVLTAPLTTNQRQAHGCVVGIIQSQCTFQQITPPTADVIHVQDQTEQTMMTSSMFCSGTSSISGRNRRTTHSLVKPCFSL